MMLRIPVSLPTLVAVVMTVTFFTCEANGTGSQLVCTCKQPDTSGTSGLALPPCIIDTTGRCGTVGNLPEHQAPGVPVEVGLESSPYLATDGKYYLDVAPHWKASPDHINLLTGYEVRVICQQNICATQSLCVTISFNRTLTVNDTHSNFSVNCRYGDFAQPGLEYAIMIGSLPKSSHNSNEARFSKPLPSCQEVPDVSKCQLLDDWIPSERPVISQLVNGSVMVTFWKNYDYPSVSVYDVTIEEVDNPSNIYYTTINLENQSSKVLFDNVQEGTYKAYIMINDEVCNDCMAVSSENSIHVRAMPTPAPSTTSPATFTTLLFTPSPHPPTLAGTSLILAALSGALGGILLVILIVILIARTCNRSLGSPSMSGGEESKLGGDPTKLTMPHHNNIPCGDFDSLQGPGYVSRWPLSNANIHHDNMTNESQFYGDLVAFKQGDSISKFAVDIHSGMDHQTSSKCDQPESPDSGLESLHYESTMDDERTVFSLALTSLGDEV